MIVPAAQLSQFIRLAPLLILVGTAGVWPLSSTLIPEHRHSSQAVNEADSLALVAFYNATEGYFQWDNNTNWLSGPLNTWYGITVVGGRVTQIQLSANDIRGKVPDEFRNLTALEALHLDENRLLYLPDLSVLGAGSLRIVNVENNSLDFRSLEPNVNQAYTLLYLPQSGFFNQPFTTHRAYEDQPFSITADTGGERSEFQWFIGIRENFETTTFPIQGATSATYSVTQASRANTTPSLVVEVTNPVVPGVTLSATYYPIFVPKNMLTWLDIGSYHHAYSPNGARQDMNSSSEGMDYPAIIQRAGHFRYKSFWVGVRDWTDPAGLEYPYYVARVGGQAGDLIPVSQQTTPVKNQLIARYDDTVVEVNGKSSFDNYAVVDAIDPDLPADRMIHTVNNMPVGITVDRKVYAYTNAYHDNYHLIDYNYCNTGNTDADEEIELPNQALRDVFFFRSHAWRGLEHASYAAVAGQEWGRYSVYDVVGDGHAEYPVDFTAIYGWIGWSIDSIRRGPNSQLYEDLGGPLLSDEHPMTLAGDSVGRLSGATMMGRAVLHADRSTVDTSYDRDQPSVISWFRNDGPYNRDGLPHESYYRFGIVGRWLGFDETDCIPCRRTSPYFAELNARGNPFWEEGLAITGGFAGGHAATIGYGPYEMKPGECINITVSEGIDGLSHDAATKIGRAYKSGGAERNTKQIPFDANGDGIINPAPHDYDNVFVGTESQTKNQWFMSTRDSLFQTFYRARDVFEASNNFTTYPMAEPPRAPLKFSVQSSPPDGVQLSWVPANQGPEIDHWEIFRTKDREDNLYVNGCLENPSIRCGYALVATLPASATSYRDLDVTAGTAYYYYIQAVGKPLSEAANAVNGTPGGIPLRSGRYLTQTYTPVTTETPSTAPPVTPTKIQLIGNYPNPFNNTTRFRYSLEQSANVRFVVYDILGREVQVLASGMQTSGLYTVDFDSKGLASGVYIYVIEAGTQRIEGTMLLVR